MAKTYDTKCLELAEHFVDDIQVSEGSGLRQMPAAWRQAKARELACEIQQTIEDWLSENDPMVKQLIRDLEGIW